MSDRTVFENDPIEIDKDIEESVIMEEQNVTTITIEDSVIEDCELDKIEENVLPVLNVQFFDDETFKLLNDTVSNAIKCCLKFKKIAIEIVPDSELKLITFHKKATADSNTSFVIDTSPMKGKVVKEIEVPSYSKTIQSVLQEKPIVEHKIPVPVRKKNVCFNCGEDDHQISECKEPKNFANIKKFKQQFQSKFSNERYHTDVQQK